MGIDLWCDAVDSTVQLLHGKIIQVVYNDICYDVSILVFNHAPDHAV
jgi:hypothetical protein